MLKFELKLSVVTRANLGHPDIGLPERTQKKKWIHLDAIN